MVVMLESPQCAGCGKRRPKILQPATSWQRIGLADEDGGIITFLTCKMLCVDIVRTRFGKGGS